MGHLRYYKRHWDETTGEELSNEWGTSTWYFETDEEDYPQRQVIIFQSGRVLRYDRATISDQWGGLGDQSLDPIEFEPFLIEPEEFEAVWNHANEAQD